MARSRAFSTFLRAISLVVALIPGLQGAAAVMRAIAVFGLNAAAADRERRMRNRAALNAYNASLRDRQIVLRSADLPTDIAYGRVRIGGVLVYARSTGQDNAQLHYVVALSCAHEIDAIEKIYVQDIEIDPIALDVDGWVTAGHFARTSEQNERHVASTTGSAAQAVTLPYVPIGSTVSAIADVYAGDGSYSAQLPIISVVGSTVTVDTSSVPPSSNMWIDYRRQIVTSFLRIRRYLGTSTQAADSVLMSASGGEWTADHRGRGRPYLAVTAIYDEDVFAALDPTQISCIVRGRKCFDPRTSTTAWTTNPAVIVRDYLTSSFGFGMPTNKIDDALVIAAANICDEIVVIGAGNKNERRYEINGTLSTEASLLDNLGLLRDAMAGVVAYTQGQWRVYAGAYRVPTITLTDADLIDVGRRETQAGVARRALFNAVKGTFISPGNNWRPTDYPAVTNATYESQDGGERIFHDLPLPLTQSVMMAQRLAKIALEDARQALTHAASYGMRAYPLGPGDTVQLTHSRYGWTNKVFKVIDRTFSLDSLVTLTLKEEAAAVYDWNYGQATTTDPAPNTTLPNPWNVAALTGLTLDSSEAQLIRVSDGAVMSRLKIAWTKHTDEGVLNGGAIEIEYRPASSENWERITVRGDETATYAAPVIDGLHYYVRVRARNGLGVRSAWTNAGPHQIIGQTAPPSNVPSIAYVSDAYGPRLVWQPVPDIDVRQYELRSGGTSWDDAQPLVGTLPTIVSGTQYAWTLRTVGSVTIRIKAIDEGGRYSVADTTTTVVVNAPGAPVVVQSLSAADVVLTITPSASGTFATDRFRVRVGATFDSATIIAEPYSTVFRERVTWLGTRTYWVSQIDVAGNEGAAARVDVYVSAPAAPVPFSVEPIINTVVMRWQAPSSMLPISRYIIKRGGTYATATLIGEKAGDQTLTVHTEPAGGSFTYWIAAIDTAGNEGTPASASANVATPANFVLLYQFNDDLSGTKTNCAVIDAKLHAPIDIAETWSTHFSARSWASPQAQIDAGYTRYFMPSTTSAQYTRVFDTGATIATAVIDMSYVATTFTGSVTISPMISVSNSSATGPWTDFTGTRALATNFRWIKVTLNVSASGGDDLVLIEGINVRLSTQVEMDSGMVTSSQFVSGVATVTFNKAFIDVQSINVTPMTTSRREVAVEFTDAPYPTTFKVRVWDPVLGVLTPTDFSWTATGVI